jgi:hypothetical protein
MEFPSPFQFFSDFNFFILQFFSVLGVMTISIFFGVFFQSLKVYGVYRISRNMPVNIIDTVGNKIHTLPEGITLEDVLGAIAFQIRERERKRKYKTKYTPTGNPMGRPRIHPLPDPSELKRPRGRPRKVPTEDSGNSEKSEI